jgi:hypothetical protein
MLAYHKFGLKTYSDHVEHMFQDMHAGEVIGNEELPAPLEELERDERVYLVKTHRQASDQERAVCLVRDGRDALVSHAHYLTAIYDKYTKEQVPWRVKSLKLFFRTILAGGAFRRDLKNLIVHDWSFGGWSNHANSWLRWKETKPVFIIRFEDLIKDPDRWMSEAFDALKVPRPCPNEAGVPDFESLHARWPSFFRKGRIGAWKEEMPRGLHELFWQHHGAMMDLLNYRRDGSIAPLPRELNVVK